ncbi:MAG: hypothetical protein AUJ50_05140 [Candidatus Aenigmarchaeota archaeon CG1_02_38_14]|nr:MAG: hypothetical protein AUJ50_05140 [Candidatus Aenigmarchaeota archaeon CG1_02_38_14]
MEKFLKVFSKDEIVTTRNNLDIILMYIPKKYITTPGFFYLLSKNLAFNNVNMIGTSNIETEVFFLFENKDLPKAYKILTELIPDSTSRNSE